MDHDDLLVLRVKEPRHSHCQPPGGIANRAPPQRKVRAVHATRGGEQGRHMARRGEISAISTESLAPGPFRAGSAVVSAGCRRGVNVQNSIHDGVRVSQHGSRGAAPHSAQRVFPGAPPARISRRDSAAPAQSPALISDALDGRGLAYRLVAKPTRQASRRASPLGRAGVEARPLAGGVTAR